MKKKLYIQAYPSEQDKYNAGSKARNDCDRILENLGYTPFVMTLGSKYRLLRFIKQLYYSTILFFKVNNYTNCFIQYPYSMRNFFLKFMFSRYTGNLECLIHDINTLRSQNYNKIKSELSGFLLKCSLIIVHTPAMKEQLVNKVGVDDSRIRILYLFDYLSTSKIKLPNLNSKEIIFAGNMNKSTFISHLSKLPDCLSFNLYGNPIKIHSQNHICKYKGKFHPDDISVIEGDWGLVWDGDSIETCQGAYGEYLKYNSSHKVSLYIAACKPVIIWEQSALRDYIVGNHLGIAINSLYDIEYSLNHLSDAEKTEIIDNVVMFSQKLRNGMSLIECISD